MLKIYTDTDTDITPEIANKYNVKLISMPYVTPEKVTYPYVDFEKFDHKAFYDTLRDGLLPSTSALSPEEYKKYFEEEFKNGNDILYIHFSAAMTATFTFMEEALMELFEKYPDRKFYRIDTKAITIGSYSIVRAIFDKLEENLPVEELIKWANDQVNHYATYFYADDLKFFKRSGRVSGISATMGTLLGIKPIICIDENGVMKSIGKAKGRKGALTKLVDYVMTLGDDVANYRITIGHADLIEVAEKLGEMLKEKLGDNLQIDYVVVNPTAGSHCGPNTVGVSFHSIHR